MAPHPFGTPKTEDVKETLDVRLTGEVESGPDMPARALDFNVFAETLVKPRKKSEFNDHARDQGATEEEQT